MQGQFNKAFPGASIHSFPTLSGGLTSCFLINEGSGNAVDISASPITIASPVWDNGNIRDWTVPLASSTKLNWSSGQFSLAVWFHCNALNGAGEVSTVAGRFNYVDESNNQGWELKVTSPENDNNVVIFNVYGNTSGFWYQVGFNLRVEAGKDYFVVVTSDGVSKVTTYKDGVQTSGRDYGQFIPVSCTLGSGFRNFSTGGTGKFPVRQLCTWNRALKPSEITSLKEDNLFFIADSGYNPKERVSQSITETIAEGDIKRVDELRLSQNVIEVVNEGDIRRYDELRLSLSMIEVIYNPNEGAIITGTGQVEQFAIFDALGTTS